MLLSRDSISCTQYSHCPFGMSCVMSGEEAWAGDANSVGEALAAVPGDGAAGA